MTNLFRSRPTTRPGWWAAGLGGAYVLLYVGLVIVMGLRLSLPPLYGIFMLLCGLAAGIAGLIAILRSHERSWLVWLALLPAALALFLILGEFLFPH